MNEKQQQVVHQAPPPILEHDGPALIIQHCAVFGRLEKQVRRVSVRIGPHAQHEVSADVSFTEPRKRRGAYYTIVPGNIRYLTIEANGRVLYDSRHDVPCDMAKWEEAARKHNAKPFFSSERV